MCIYPFICFVRYLSVRPFGISRRGVHEGSDTWHIWHGYKLFPSPSPLASLLSLAAHTPEAVHTSHEAKRKKPSVGFTGMSGARWEAQREGGSEGVGGTHTLLALDYMSLPRVYMCRVHPGLDYSGLRLNSTRSFSWFLLPVPKIWRKEKEREEGISVSLTSNVWFMKTRGDKTVWRQHGRDLSSLGIDFCLRNIAESGWAAYFRFFCLLVLTLSGGDIKCSRIACSDSIIREERRKKRGRLRTRSFKKSNERRKIQCQD